MLHSSISRSTHVNAEPESRDSGRLAQRQQQQEQGCEQLHQVEEVVVCEEVGRQRSGILGVCEELVIVLAFLQRQDNLSTRVGTEVPSWRGGGAGSGAGHRGQDMVQESLIEWPTFA